MQYSFILLEPQTPENIGAAARALKTMGFSDLRLINPCDYLNQRARWTAHGSEEILEKAQVFETLADAGRDIDFLIGTTPKKRSVKYDFYTVNQLPDIIQRKGDSIRSVAILFGNEDNGLPNRVLAQCDLLSYIPMAVEFPVINLAQAVMIYAFILFPEPLHDVPKKVIDRSEYVALKNKFQQLMQDLGIPARDPFYHRLLERLAVLSDIDIHLAHSLCTKISDRLRSGSDSGTSDKTDTAENRLIIK